MILYERRHLKSSQLYKQFVELLELGYLIWKCLNNGHESAFHYCSNMFTLQKLACVQWRTRKLYNWITMATFNLIAVMDGEGKLRDTILSLHYHTRLPVSLNKATNTSYSWLFTSKLTSEKKKQKQIVQCCRTSPIGTLNLKLGDVKLLGS